LLHRALPCRAQLHGMSSSGAGGRCGAGGLALAVYIAKRVSAGDAAAVGNHAVGSRASCAAS
jgi:hypothetical protein